MERAAAFSSFCCFYEGVIMPNPEFNTYFLHLFVDSCPEEGNEEGLYFSPSPESDSQSQLTQFETSAQYDAFQRQYKALLDGINQWSIEHQVQVTLSSKDKPIPALTLFGTRLFGSENYYRTRKVLLFHEGKKSLERFYRLLQDKRIHLDNRKDSVSNLQNNMSVCADGVLTNILDAADDLLALTGIYHHIATVKRKLIQ